MICPNCKSNIPDDSKFCPDCGAPVVNIEELRAKAKEIAIQYKKGYDFYVNDGILPSFVNDMSDTNCEKIIEAKNHIIAKHVEIDAIDKQNEHNAEEAIKKEVCNLSISYAKGYDFYVKNGTITNFVHNISVDACRKIITFKNDIIKKHQEIEAEERKEEQRILEKKRKEEQSVKKLAYEIKNSYPKGYCHYVDTGVLPTINYYSGISDCRKIMSYKESIIQKHNQIEEKENEEKLKLKANSIKEQCKPDGSTNIIWAVILTIMIYIWMCIEQSSEAFGKNLCAPVFGFFIYFIIKAFLNNPETIQKKKIEDWKKQHPNDPICKYL